MTTSTADRSAGLRLGADTRVTVDAVGAVPQPGSEERSAIPDGGPRAALLDQLSQAQYDAVAATVSRRRSLTDSLQVALAAYWDTVVAQRDAHRTARTLPAEAPVEGRPPLRPGEPAAVTGWLGLIIDAHQMRWELPEAQLALLVSATLEGLTVDYLASGNPQPARAVLQVLAYQVGRYGRRPAKNQQH